MIEQVLKMAIPQEGATPKTIEKVIHDENVHFNHMLLNKGEGLPIHFSNSTVYMAVMRGTLTIALGDQEAQIYEAGTLLKIPFNIQMDVQNKHDALLELIVVKAPAPQNA